MKYKKKETKISKKNSQNTKLFVWVFIVFVSLAQIEFSNETHAKYKILILCNLHVWLKK